MINRFRSQSATDFEEVYARAFFRKVLSLLIGRKQDTRLLSFEEVKEKIRCHDESYAGLRTVPVSAILGSVGRYKDFNSAFLPLTRTNKERWRRVDEAYYRDILLPPVQLYKVGDVYFVKDGNHRISVAKERGIAYVDAEVIETHCRVSLPADIEAEDLEEVGARALFLEWSRLDQLRPKQDVRVTVPGGYHELEEHINVHRYFMQERSETEVPLWDAVTSWYDNVYMPVVQAIRDDKILEKIPKHRSQRRTETDLYLWIMNHLHELRQRYGDEFPAEDAVQDYMEMHSKSSVTDAIRQRVAALAKGSKP